MTIIVNKTAAELVADIVAIHELAECLIQKGGHRYPYRQAIRVATALAAGQRVPQANIDDVVGDLKKITDEHPSELWFEDELHAVRNRITVSEADRIAQTKRLATVEQWHHRVCVEDALARACQYVIAAMTGTNKYYVDDYLARCDSAVRNCERLIGTKD